MDSSNVQNVPKLPQTSQGAHSQTVASILFFSQSLQLKKLNQESQKTHKLEIEKKEKQDVPCELQNTPSIPIRPWKDFNGLWLKPVNMGMVLERTKIFSK